MEYTASDGKVYKTQFYNLDAILSVGYRVNSVNATAFRRWATSVLKQQSQIDFFVRTSLPPVEGVFFDGQMWDAYELSSKLIKSARQRIVLIDNYIDDTVLTLLDKRAPGVMAEIYTMQISKQLALDIAKHVDRADSLSGPCMAQIISV